MAIFCPPLRRGLGRSCRLLGLAAVLCIATRVEAADRFWDSTAGGNFTSSANWQSCGFFCNPIPDSDDVAHFGTSSPPSPFQFVYTVTFANNPTTNALLIEDDFVTFDLNGHTYTNSHSPFTIATQIGNQSGRAGSLTVTDGLLDIDSGVFVGIAGGNGGLGISSGGSVQSEIFARIGASGSSGTVNVTGASSQWIHAGETSVGWGGTGTMNITGGALVQGVTNLIADGVAPGTVTVSGANSRWTNSSQMFIGNGGNGTLNITAGGRVRNTAGHIGFAATNISTVSVDGAQWTNSGDLFVGDLGDGLMNVTGGGLVQSVNSAIGAAPGSAGAVTVTSSTNIASNWVNSGELNVGHSGAGTLEILTAGAVFNTNAYIGRFAGSTGVAIVNGPDATWTNSGNLTVGNNDYGELRITNRALVQNVDGIIGAAAGSTGLVTLTGPLAFWFNSGLLRVGDSGNGTLNIEAGGAVSNVEGHVGFDVGSTGTALVDGAGSKWTNSGELTIGRDGDGTLDITGGGLVQNTNGYIGRSSGGDGSGAVTVSGAGSTWTNTNFVYVGYDSEGEGSLSVEAGGTVTCTTGFVGNVAGSHGTATVDGPGSTWTTSGTLAVGDGTLTISNGGAVVTNGLFGTLAAASMWNAEVSVVGQGSSWSLADALLTVGFGGAAAVNILDSGNVVSFDARLAADTGSTGTVVVSGTGSTWTIGRRLGVGGDAGNLISGGTGTLRVQPGGRVDVAQNIVIFADGLLQLEGGTLDAAEVSFQGGGQFDWTSGTLHVGTFNGNLLNQGGTLAPGHSAGQTTITGSYAQQPGAKLQIEIGGTSAGAFDVVNIGAIAGISGQLQLVLINGFEPAAGDAFTVFTTAGGIFGTFVNVANGQRLTTLDSLGSFLVHYGPGSAFDPSEIVLSNFLAVDLPGDYNQNGIVDAADYVLWRNNLGSGTSLLNDDTAGVGPDDYDRWKTNFGQTAGSGSGASANAAVPEPATLVLLMFAAAGSAGWCLRRGRAA